MPYLDHSATTPVADEVFAAMEPFLRTQCGNPSSVHTVGRMARQAVEAAREQVATLLGARPTEIVFTSGGTESDNLALKGVAEQLQRRGRHIVTTTIEHHAVLHTCEALTQRGFEVTILPVNGKGLVAPDELRAALRDDTILVSIIHANNEIGTLQDIAALTAVAHERGALFHTDAVQSFGHVPVNVETLGVDLLSLSGHKLHGPKGVGALYVRRGRRLQPLLDGGGQEKNRRSGTENVPGIVGLGAACALAQRDFAAGEMERVAALRDRLIAGVLEAISAVELTGDPTQRLPSLASFVVRGVEGEGLVLGMDDRGYCVSTGSACSSGSLDPSHVLIALGYEWAQARGSVRFSLGRGNSSEEIDGAITALSESVAALRALAA